MFVSVFIACVKGGYQRGETYGKTLGWRGGVHVEEIQTFLPFGTSSFSDGRRKIDETGYRRLIKIKINWKPQKKEDVK